MSVLIGVTASSDVKSIAVGVINEDNRTVDTTQFEFDPSCDVDKSVAEPENWPSGLRTIIDKLRAQRSESGIQVTFAEHSAVIPRSSPTYLAFGLLASAGLCPFAAVPVKPVFDPHGDSVLI